MAPKRLANRQRALGVGRSNVFPIIGRYRASNLRSNSIAQVISSRDHGGSSLGASLDHTFYWRCSHLQAVGAHARGRGWSRSAAFPKQAHRLDPRRLVRRIVPPELLTSRINSFAPGQSETAVLLCEGEVGECSSADIRPLVLRHCHRQPSLNTMRMRRAKSKHIDNRWADDRGRRRNSRDIFLFQGMPRAASSNPQPEQAGRHAVHHKCDDSRRDRRGRRSQSSTAGRGARGSLKSYCRSGIAWTTLASRCRRQMLSHPSTLHPSAAPAASTRGILLRHRATAVKPSPGRPISPIRSRGSYRELGWLLSSRQSWRRARGVRPGIASQTIRPSTSPCRKGRAGTLSSSHRP